MTRHLRTVTGILLLFALTAAPSCTFLKVGDMVKNGFAKGLLKGNPKKAAKNATPAFAKVIRSLSEKEFKLLMKLGVSSQKGTKKGRSKGPGIKYHSFHSSGNEALLIMRAGKARFKFYCKYVKGKWKVDDMVITGTLKLSLREVMGIFRAALNVFEGLLKGSAARASLEGDLELALVKAAPYLKPFVQKLARSLSAPEEKGSKAKRKAPLPSRASSSRRIAPGGASPCCLKGSEWWSSWGGQEICGASRVSS